MGAGRSARIAVRRRLGNRLGRHDAAAVTGPGGQDPVVAQEMEPGRGDQSRQLLQQFQQREQEMAGPIRPRRFELIIKYGYRHRLFYRLGLAALVMGFFLQIFGVWICK